MNWFRFYNDAVHDPKVQCLPGDLFKAWVNLLCLASKHRGELPSMTEVAYVLRFDPEEIEAVLTKLAEAGLFEQDETGAWAPHNWTGRQPGTDYSTPRVHKHRRLKQARETERNEERNRFKPFKIDREKEEKLSQERVSLPSLAEETPTPAPAPAPNETPPPDRTPPAAGRAPHLVRHPAEFGDRQGMSKDMGIDHRSPPPKRDDPPMTDANEEALRKLHSGRKGPPFV